ncbi:CapA family protein [[Clostridium] innocuum]|nr:CapA family protein [[Clostridium] innocuum]
MEKRNSPYILIAGDLVPTRKNFIEFSNGDILSLIHDDFKTIWDNASLRVFNLETPITDSSDEFMKAGTFLGAKAATFEGIKNLNPSLVCLANNHIMDLGVRGAYDTIGLLDNANIPYIGFGNNLNEMVDFRYFVVNNKKIGFFNCCEHEFTYAKEDSCGTSVFNPLSSLFRIQELKKECDYLIIIYHGGRELYEYCTPKLKETCHAIAKAGADLIICQHSHCISCSEIFEDTHIIYGQGNFIFDIDEEGLWEKLTKNSLLVKLNLENLSIEFIGFHKEGKKIKLDLNQQQEDFKKRSKDILDNEFVKQKYIEDIKYKSYHYFRQILSTQFLGALDKRIFKSYFMRKRYKKLRLLLINYFDCEVHIENILTYLKEINVLYRN